MIGKTTSHYKIVEKLGSGGMGDVYKAEDTKLRRTVAMKFLPPHLTRDEDAKNRFLHEARAASALDHRHIGSIFEIDETDDGQMFIAMAYYNGESLKEKIEQGILETDEAIEIVTQIAGGLSKAHSKNIVHRDIKPANIVITDDGEVKIIDFGLAKLSGQTKLTQAGMTVGTAAYMSPEQARGDVVDHRTDIWALGVLLYELLTGQLPFKSEYEQALIYSILNEEPESVRSVNADIPTYLENILNKALAKNADDRYQEMDELLTDLKSPGKIGPAVVNVRSKWKTNLHFSRRVLFFSGVSFAALVILVSSLLYFPGVNERYVQASIAVLPFRDLSREQDQEYFCDGMTEDILTKLSKISNLKVIARTSVMRFKKTDKSIKDIGQVLGVESIVEGSIRREKDNIRVTAQLINVADESHLWAENYDKKLESVFQLQEDVSKSIARALQIQLAPEEEIEITSEQPKDVEAYEYYLKGMYQLNRRYVISGQESSFNKALDMFNKAIQIDSLYALPYVGRGRAYIQKFDASAYQDREALAHASVNYKRALQLDPGSAEANTGMGIIHSIDHDYDSAYESLKTSLGLNPNIIETNFSAAMLLRNRGLFQQSIKFFSRAKELDPFRVAAYANLAQDLIHTGKFAEAQIVVEKGKEIEPEFVPLHSMEVQLAIIEKDYELAGKIIEQAEKIHPERIALDKSLFLSATGDKDGALAFLEHPVFFMVAGEVFAQLGMIDEAIVAITDEIAQGRSHYYYENLIQNPLLENLKEDPRFKKIVTDQKKKHAEYEIKYSELRLD